MHDVSRRRVLVGPGLFGAVLFVSRSHLSLAERMKEVHQLKPGEFTWHPERSKQGPVAVIVSIPDQLVHVYRNGVRIAVSTCSTGKAGHGTPTGVFTILEKDKDHHSSTYNNAPMPNMNRLTWSGVALHAGNLPGYPASHGCVRLPMKFSELLFSVTHVGTPVIIAGSHSQPREVVHPGLVLADYAEHEFDKVQSHLKGKVAAWAPHVTNFSGPASVVISSADRSGTLIINGEVVGQCPVVIRNPEVPLGSHVFVLAGLHDDARGLAWHSISHHHEQRADSSAPEERVIDRISASPEVQQRLHAYMHPGMTMVTTDLPTHADTRSGKDFVVMATETS